MCSYHELTFLEKLSIDSWIPIFPYSRFSDPPLLVLLVHHIVYRQHDPRPNEYVYNIYREHEKDKIKFIDLLCPLLLGPTLSAFSVLIEIAIRLFIVYRMATFWQTKMQDGH